MAAAVCLLTRDVKRPQVQLKSAPSKQNRCKDRMKEMKIARIG
jgi:hypothetical protein